MYTILIFSPFGPDVDTKFYLGYITITIVCFHLIVSFTSIFRSMFKMMLFRLKQRSMRSSFKYNRLLLQKKLELRHAKYIARLQKRRQEAEECSVEIEVTVDSSLGEEEEEVKRNVGLQRTLSDLTNVNDLLAPQNIPMKK